MCGCFRVARLVFSVCLAYESGRASTIAHDMVRHQRAAAAELVPCFEWSCLSLQRQPKHCCCAALRVCVNAAAARRVLAVTWLGSRAPTRSRCHHPAAHHSGLTTSALSHADSCSQRTAPQAPVTKASPLPLSHAAKINHPALSHTCSGHVCFPPVHWTAQLRCISTPLLLLLAPGFIVWVLLLHL